MASYFHEVVEVRVLFILLDDGGVLADERQLSRE
jgi:hypothetical protein